MTRALGFIQCLEIVDKQSEKHRVHKKGTIDGSQSEQVEKQNRGVRCDTRCYFNVRSKADMSQLNLPHGVLDNAAGSPGARCIKILR